MKTKKMTPSLSDISIIAWLLENQFVNEKQEVLSFKEHLFLYDIYRDFSKNITIKKAAQVGVSTTMILKALFYAKTRGITTIYTLPSDDDVFEFVPTKVNKIIQSNPVLLEAIQIDKVELKEINNTFVHFKGTRSKTAPIMTTADLLIHDEIDRSEQPIIEMYGSRISRSEYKGTWLLSNPSQAGVGVDQAWQKSDKKEWHVTCQACKDEQPLVWEYNIDYTTQSLVCRNCHKVFTDEERRVGRWIATASGSWSGYHISQLMAPWLTVAELIEIQSTKGTEYFRNFVLGEPFDVADVKISRELITDLWTPKDLPKTEYYLGVDSGKIKHYVLGSSEGITDIGATDDWQDIEFLIKKFNPVAVIDALPDLTPADHLRRTYPRVFVCYYKRDRMKAEMFDFRKFPDGGVVYADRNRCIDAVIDDMVQGKFLISTDASKLKSYIQHWLTLRRIKDQDNLGIDRYIWESSSGVDHYVHATVYWWLAKTRGRGSEFSDQVEEKPTLIKETMQGPIISDIVEYMKQKQEVL